MLSAQTLFRLTREPVWPPGRNAITDSLIAVLAHDNDAGPIMQPASLKPPAHMTARHEPMQATA